MKINILIIIGIFLSLSCFAQDATHADNSYPQFNTHSSKDARFYRPSIFQHQAGDRSFAIGGYAQANTQYFVTDGEGDGLSMQFRQLNLFTQSSLMNNRLNFLLNVEFDPVEQQISLREAALDFRFAKGFNLRGGIVLPPIGYFNQNGDSPNSDFIDFPLSSTTIIPSLLSEAGFGFHGNIDVVENVQVTYEAYLVNGLQEGVIDNDIPRTFLPLGNTEGLFGADNNGKLAYTGRIGVHKKHFGEVGVSYYSGAYNITEFDETEVDESRSLSIFAIDGQVNFANFSLLGELAIVNIDVHEGLIPIFADKQVGYHLEASYPILSKVKLLGTEDNQLRLALRYEVADYNVGDFIQTETKIYDETQGIRAGLALRFGKTSVLKANYSYLWEKDILGNLAKIGGIQFGLATYF